MSLSPSHTISKHSGHSYTDWTKLSKNEVRTWLEQPIQAFILDYLTIKNGYESFGIADLHDYSYLITPAFKALEGTLIQVGKGLGFKVEDYHFRIGVVFSDDNLEKFYKDVLDQIESFDKEYKEDIQLWLNDAKRMLRHFRHSPAHFLGERKESWEEAFSFGDHILRIINEMCFSLIKSGIYQQVPK